MYRKFLSIPKKPREEDYYRTTKEEYESMDTERAIHHVLSDDIPPHPDDKDLYEELWLVHWVSLIAVFIVLGMAILTIIVKLYF